MGIPVSVKQAIEQRSSRIEPSEAIMAEQHGEQGQEWRSSLRTNKDGAIIRNSAVNAQLCVENDKALRDVLAFDEFSEKIIKTSNSIDAGLVAGDWLDSDDSILRVYLERSQYLLFSKDNLNDATVASAMKHIVNPVKDRIEAVKWDRKPRAECYFIDYLGAENNHYTRMVTRKWLAGAVARVYNPGVKFEVIPMLEGKQGIGKSTAVKNLYPDYFNDNLKTMGKHKDDYQKLMGSWIIELAELSAMNRTDIETVKNFTSATSDYYRNSYAHNPRQHPRKNVFIGTTNHKDYLKDATGERRFYPVKCGIHKATKNPLKPNQNDILQVLAEVKTWVDAGEKLYLDNQTIAEAKAYQNGAQVISPMKEAIEDYLSMLVPDNWDELSTSVKTSYYRALSGGQAVPENNWLGVKLSSTRVLLSQTTAREILEVVFDKTIDKYLIGNTNGDAKKVKLIMDNADGWAYKANVIINGHRTRGYKRIS